MVGMSQSHLAHRILHEIQVQTGVGWVSGHEGCSDDEYRFKSTSQISSHLRPKPRFWPKSAARLAVGEDPLIGMTLK